MKYCVDRVQVLPNFAIDVPFVAAVMVFSYFKLIVMKNKR